MHCNYHALTDYDEGSRVRGSLLRKVNRTGVPGSLRKRCVLNRMVIMSPAFLVTRRKKPGRLREIGSYFPKHTWRSLPLIAVEMHPYGPLRVFNPINGDTMDIPGGFPESPLYDQLRQMINMMEETDFLGERAVERTAMKVKVQDGKAAEGCH